MSKGILGTGLAPFLLQDELMSTKDIIKKITNFIV
jgi:hypothetical protein